jgi:hypothetical protein
VWSLRHGWKIITISRKKRRVNSLSN